MSSDLSQIIITDVKLLSLLQLSDSFFPTGAFTHSYGLETYIQNGMVSDKNTLLQVLETYLLESLATSDCPAMLLAYRAEGSGDWNRILELDAILTAQKLARESREASHSTGKRMLRAVLGLFPDKRLEQLNELVCLEKTFGNHAVIYGLIAWVIGLGESEAALGFVYTSTAGMVNNAVRLIPLGQNDGQWVLLSLAGVIRKAVEKSFTVSLGELGATAPALEIRSMQHERLYSRLFMS